MPLKLKRKNIFWILIYGILIILGTQFLVSYIYKKINQKNENFISDKIENQKIVDFDTLPYTLGKGYFIEMILSNKKSYPLFLQNEVGHKERINLNGIVNKNFNSKIFTVKEGDNEDKFEILTTKSEENFMRVLFFCFSLFIISGTFYNYGIEREKQN